jgi:hypothetical protein
MPIHEYVCQDCQREFEAFFRSDTVATRQGPAVAHATEPTRLQQMDDVTRHLRHRPR